MSNAIFDAVSRGIKDATVNLSGSSFRWRNTIVQQCRWPEVCSKGTREYGHFIVIRFTIARTGCWAFCIPWYESLEFTYVASCGWRSASASFFVAKFSVCFLTCNKKNKHITSRIRENIKYIRAYDKKNGTFSAKSGNLLMRSISLLYIISVHLFVN